jgi:hypothetical protein
VDKLVRDSTKTKTAGILRAQGCQLQVNDKTGAQAKIISNSVIVIMQQWICIAIHEYQGE